MLGYIYKIINDINDKVYIGKTLSTPEKRFKEHIRDSQIMNREIRPLYRAMNKYGIKHFQVTTIEQVPIEQLSQREQFWINHYNSYHYGYNATLGGDGKQLYDYDKIINGFLSGKLVKELAQEFECDQGTISKALKTAQIDTSVNEIKSKEKSIAAYDATGQLIQQFSSHRDASQWLLAKGYAHGRLDNVSATIGRVKNGQRKTAYGFIWK